MKKSLRLFQFLVLMLITTALSAQERRVSGKVVGAADQIAIPNVNVFAKGTNAGIATDLDGRYSLIVPQGATVLVFRAVGYVTKEVTIGTQTTIDVQLTEDANDLGEFIVTTAQGISRDRRALGFALSEVKSELLEQRPESNVQNITKR